MSVTIVAELQSSILKIQENKALYEEANFNIRADALDFIDFHIIDRIGIFDQNEDAKEEFEFVKTLARNLTVELEIIDRNLFRKLREQIGAANDKSVVLRDIICKYCETDISAINESGKTGYDNLDIFINGILSEQKIPEPTKNSEPEMIFYQKTPARIIFEMLAKAQIKEDDVFFDLGSGLGQVAILTNLISGVSAKGIEYETVYCDYARQSAVQLNLSNISFINKDARNMDYSEGSIFFLYTPFKGKILDEVMGLLRKAAQKKPIRIFTYGPCSASIAQLNWLTCVSGNLGDASRLYEFKSVMHEGVQ